jgi:hypothetical protein
VIWKPEQNDGVVQEHWKNITLKVVFKHYLRLKIFGGSFP